MIKKGQIWEIEVQLIDAKKQTPLLGNIVECWDRDTSFDKDSDQLLWQSTTNGQGKCQGLFGENQFQNYASARTPKSYPDLYFKIKDRLGNTLLNTKVTTNLKSGFSSFSFQVPNTLRSQFSAGKQPLHYWTILGELLPSIAGRRLSISAYSKNKDPHHLDELIFSTTTDLKGKFEQFFDENDFTSSGTGDVIEGLYFVIKNLKKEVSFVSEIFKELPRDHIFFLQLDRQIRTSEMTAIPMAKTSVNWLTRKQNPKAHRFPKNYDSATKFRSNPDSVIIDPIFQRDYAYLLKHYPYQVLKKSNQKVIWHFEVQILSKSTTKPVKGAIVEAIDKDFAKGKPLNDLLWVATTDKDGFCQGVALKTDFSDPSTKHFDKGKPDVFFVVKDRLGNLLQTTEVKSDLDATLHTFTFKVNTKPNLLRNLAKKKGLKWKISALVTSQFHKEPLILSCFDKNHSLDFGTENLLFTHSIEAGGVFEFEFSKADFNLKKGSNEAKPDLFFTVHSQGGNLIYSSPTFTNLKASSGLEVHRFNLDLDVNYTIHKLSSLPITSGNPGAGGAGAGGAGGGAGGAGGGGGGPLLNSPPSTSLNQPSGNLVQGEFLRIDYLVSDPEADPVYIETSYSIDQGVTFQQATEAQHPLSEGVTGLSTSLAGVNHIFIWNAKLDLSTLPAQDILFRMQAFDPKAGNRVTSLLFNIGNAVSIVIEPSLAGSTKGAFVGIRYKLTKDPADSINIIPKFSLDGTNFQAAREASNYGSEGKDSLSCSPGGDIHWFFWDAYRDLATSATPNTVFFSIENADALQGGSDTTGPFQIDMSNFPPNVDVWAPLANTRHGSPVTIDYVLSDQQNDAVDIAAFFSIDQGNTYHPATSTGFGDGITNLAATSAGDNFQFSWDALSDLPTLPQDDIIFKIQVSDSNAGGIDISPNFNVGATVRPKVEIIDPNSGIWGAPVPINYYLSHPSGNTLLNVGIDFSIDGGQSFGPATELTQAGSEGLQNLRADAIGVRHFFIWDAIQDIPSLLNDVQRAVQLRIRAFLGASAGEALSNIFDIDAHFLGIPDNPPPLATSTGRPRAEIVPISDPNSPITEVKGIHAPIHFFLDHPESARVNVRMEFAIVAGSSGAQTFRPASAAKGSDQLTNLPAPKFKADYRFLWDFQKDLNQSGLTTAQVQLRLTPYIGALDGLQSTCPPFNVTIEDTPPLAKVPPKTQFSSLSMQIDNGDNQVIIPGFLAKDNLSIELRDAQNELVKGARIAFSVGVGSQAEADFEEHPTLRTTTNQIGKAGIRVRPKSGAEGSLKIKATVVGMPAVSATFDLEVKVPEFRLSGINPSTPYKYGKVYTFSFSLQSGTNPYLEEFKADANEPILIKVSTLNAEADAKVIHLPGVRFNSGINFSVNVIPSLLGATAMSTSTDRFNLKVEALNVQGVIPFEQQFSIQTDNNVRHLASVAVISNRYTPNYQDKRLSLEVISGFDPANPALKLPQVSYPGLTLSTPFQVKVVDDSGETYTEVTNTRQDIRQRGNCAAISFQKEPLKIRWEATNGVLATSAIEGTQSFLEASVNQPVYFTPSAGGHWKLYARVIGNAHDHLAQRHPYILRRRQGGTWVSDPHCAYRPGFSTNLERNFFIQYPELIGFEDLSLATPLVPGPILNQVKAGLQSKLLVRDLSPFAQISTPEEIELKANGRTVTQYIGSGLEFERKIALQRDPQNPNILRSAPLIFKQNEQSTLAGISLGVLPLSKVHAHFLGYRFAVKVSGLRRQRLRYGSGGVEGDSEFLYESPVGTSPVGGAHDSVTLATGEFIFDRCDIGFDSRVDSVEACRTYRSMVQSLQNEDDDTDVVEPFGAGWFADFGLHLEVHHQYLRLWDGTGVYYDFPQRFPGKGQFIHILEHETINADQSAFMIRDRHRNYFHFNIDGSLRYYIDRLGNKFEYRYNGKGQLVEIRDCLLPDTRKLILSYYPDSTLNRDNKWVDKIHEITDFSGRKTTYDYYAKGELRNGIETGGEGFLKKVNFPETKTLFEGANSPVNHRSYELFEYEKDSRLGWRLKKVFAEDSKGNEQLLFTNTYDVEGRIVMQEEAEGFYALVRPALNEVHLTDKNTYLTKFVFPESPYWNATAPKETTDAENNKAELRHNTHGHLVYLKPSKGSSMEYVYNEDSNYARARANLLGTIETSEQGKERITTYNYSRRHHLLTKAVGPEGNLPGVDPRLHHQVINRLRNGNVEERFGPVALNWIYTPLNTGDRRIRFRRGALKQTYTYNSFGQLMSLIDERGVKTEYKYYAANNPTRGAISPTGGGLLAQELYDTEQTSDRQDNIPGNDALPQLKTVTYEYNALGQLTGIVDQNGIRTSYTRSKLGDIIKEEHGIGVPGLNLTKEHFFGPKGEAIRSETRQPGQGTSKVEVWQEYDDYGRLKKEKTKINDGNEVVVDNVYDTGDRLEKILDNQTGIETSIEYTHRNQQKKLTVKSGAVQLEESADYHENGELKEVVDSAGNKTSYDLDDFGEIVKTTDDATGLSSEIILNDAGKPVVEIERDTAGGVGSAREIVYDDQDRVRRVHQMRFKKTTSGSARSLSKLPENLGDYDASYLSSLGEFIPDLGFGANDGRTTMELGWGIGEDLAQVKDDSFGRTMFRSDAHGRALEVDDLNETRINTVYDDSNHKEESSFTAKSEDPLFPETPYTFKLVSTFNEAGVLRSEMDEKGRLTQFEPDDSGNLIRVTNPEHAETILKYDDLNNVEETEFELSVSGNHTAAELSKLMEGIEAYNAEKKLRGRIKFDASGKLTSTKDNLNNEFSYRYKDNQLEKIVYPGSHGEEVFTYDGAGRLHTHTDAGGQLTTYNYEDGRLKGVKVGQEETEILYTDDGLIETIRDKIDHTKAITYQYDSQGNILKESRLSSNTSTAYKYDGAGRMTMQQFSPTDFLEYLYDSQTGKLKEIKDQSGTLAKYSYYGNTLKHENINGLNTEYIFTDGQLSESRTTGVIQGDINTSFKFDLLDRLVESIETFNGQRTIRNYVYDTAGRVLKEELKLPSLNEPLIIRYFYDADDFIRKEERDEFNMADDTIERVIIRFERDELGRTKEFEEISRSVVHSAVSTGSGPIVQP